MLRRLHEDPNPLNRILNGDFHKRDSAISGEAYQWSTDPQGLGGLNKRINIIDDYTASTSVYRNRYGSTGSVPGHIGSKYAFALGQYNSDFSLTNGDYYEVGQVVDLTDVTYLVFGFAAQGGNGGTGDFTVKIGATTELTVTVNSSQTGSPNKVIDVSSYSGDQWIYFTLQATVTDAAAWISTEIVDVRVWPDFASTGRDGPIYCVNERTDNMSVSVTTTDADYPASNVLDGLPDNTGRCGALSDAFMRIDFGDNSNDLLTPGVNFVALINHNFAETEVVSYQANEADSWGSPPIDAEFTWNAGTMWMVSAPFPLVLRYHRILTDGNQHREEPIEIGCIVLGTYNRLTRMYSYGQVITRGYGLVENITDGGRSYRAGRASRGGYIMSFEDLTPDEMFELVWLHTQTRGAYAAHTLVPAPDDPDYPNDVLFGLNRSSIQSPEKEFELYDQTLEYSELVWGAEK